MPWKLKKWKQHKWGSIQFSFWLLTSEHLLIQISNYFPPFLVVPVGGKETFHPNQQAPYCKENTFLELGEKKTQLNFGVVLIFSTPSISCTIHFSVQIQIIVASFGSLVTLHHVHNFNDLYSKVVEQWSPPRDLEVSEVCVQKTQLVASLETSVGLNVEWVGEGRRLT